MKPVAFYCISLLFTFCATTYSETVKYNFDDFADGELHGQKQWYVNTVKDENKMFRISDQMGRTNQKGDKALCISSAGYHVNIQSDNGVNWVPGETLTVEMDFLIGLGEKSVKERQNALSILIGDRSLDKSSRWQLSLGIHPNGEWSLRGKFPHWENMRPLPADTFVERSTNAPIAISGWFNFKAISTKTSSFNEFKNIVIISDADGNQVVKYTFKTSPLEEGAPSIYEDDDVYVGFGGKDNINGLVCIDNLKITSRPSVAVADN